MVIKNAEDTARVYGRQHPYIIVSNIMDTVAELYSPNHRVFIRTLNGEIPKVKNINRLAKEGRLCWCITDPE